MQTNTARFALTATIAMTLATSAFATNRHHRQTRSSTHAAGMPSGMKLSATLNGSSEIPAGDPDASGSFSATFNPGHSQLCYELKVAALATPTAAHIHVGAAGQNGAPVVMLAPPATGSSKACLTIAADLAKKLLETPESYYVNVHNAQFPNGGLRGQLSK